MIRIWIGFCLIFTSYPLTLTTHAGQLNFPAPGLMVHLSPESNPPVLKGVTVHPENPFRFDFILDKGDSYPDDSKAEATKLIKYFLASITTPEKDLWVNLSPYEKNRIVPESFGHTEMGRDLLAQDYLLKQITASLIYPEDEFGKKFWKRIYEEAVKRFGTTNIPVNTFNKVWIVPEHAKVYEHGNTAFVVKARLKVMLEEDYLTFVKKQGQRNDVNALGSQIIREIVIPALETEVNEGKNFAPLRQVYNSLVLAVWFKKRMKDSILGRKYMDQNKAEGIHYERSVILSAAKDLNVQNDTQAIYQRYLQAFKKGVYNYIKEESDPLTQQAIPRKYFSGGAQMGDATKTTEISDTMMESELSEDRGNFETVFVNLASHQGSQSLGKIDQQMDAEISNGDGENTVFIKRYIRGGESKPSDKEEVLKSLEEKGLDRPTAEIVLGTYQTAMIDLVKKKIQDKPLKLMRVGEEKIGARGMTMLAYQIDDPQLGNNIIVKFPRPGQKIKDGRNHYDQVFGFLALKMLNALIQSGMTQEQAREELTQRAHKGIINAYKMASNKLGKLFTPIIIEDLTLDVENEKGEFEIVHVPYVIIQEKVDVVSRQWDPLDQEEKEIAQAIQQLGTRPLYGLKRQEHEDRLGVLTKDKEDINRKKDKLREQFNHLHNELKRAGIEDKDAFNWTKNYGFTHDDKLTVFDADSFALYGSPLKLSMMDEKQLDQFNQTYPDQWSPLPFIFNVLIDSQWRKVLLFLKSWDKKENISGKIHSIVAEDLAMGSKNSDQAMITFNEYESFLRPILRQYDHEQGLNWSDIVRQLSGENVDQIKGLKFQRSRHIISDAELTQEEKNIREAKEKFIEGDVDGAKQYLDSVIKGDDVLARRAKDIKDRMEGVMDPGLTAMGRQILILEPTASDVLRAIKTLALKEGSYGQEEIKLQIAIGEIWSMLNIPNSRKIEEFKILANILMSAVATYPDINDLTILIENLFLRLADPLDPFKNTIPQEIQDMASRMDGLIVDIQGYDQPRSGDDDLLAEKLSMRLLLIDENEIIDPLMTILRKMDQVSPEDSSRQFNKILVSHHEDPKLVRAIRGLLVILERSSDIKGSSNNSKVRDCVALLLASLGENLKEDDPILNSIAGYIGEWQESSGVARTQWVESMERYGVSYLKLSISQQAKLLKSILEKKDLAQLADTDQSMDAKLNSSAKVLKSAPGGIDLTADRMKVDVESDKASMIQPLDLKALEGIEINGLYIKSIEFKPLNDLPQLLGVSN